MPKDRNPEAGRGGAASVFPVLVGPAAAATAAMFLSASLLFFIQPLYARLIVPLLGGSAAVWTTAMLFFQGMLILGYAYAHLVSRHLRIGSQIGVHLAVWSAALIVLPLAVAEDWRFDPDRPAQLQVLALLAAGVGLPFFALAANAPLLQHWYSRTGAAGASDPYFLYGASNLGSLLALLSYPLFFEQTFGISQISGFWAAGYYALGPLLAVCGALALMGRGTAARSGRAEAMASTRLSARQVGFWVLLAFIPSSMMLGITAKIASDIGSFPLIWVIPLSIFLLTYVIAFSRRELISLRVARSGFIVTAAAVCFPLAFGMFLALGWWGFGLLISFFFFTALLAHRLLYDSRPHTGHLTAFYFAISIGGALGGVFNSLVAPAVFSAAYEAELVIVLAAFVLLGGGLKLPRDLTYAVFAGIVILGSIWLDLHFGKKLAGPALSAAVLLFAWNRAGPFALITAIILVTGAYLGDRDVVMRERSFFGIYKVTESAQTGLRRLVHGTTMHGMQFIDDTEGKPRPTAYYHEKAPLGQIFSSGRVADDARIGIVGLGTGALACYRRGAQEWRFYEIDPVVDRIARNPTLFRFVPTCAGDAPTHIGDARSVLKEQADLRLDVLVVDAFSSDSVPLHLLTREAVDLYLSRLTDDGILILHISNRYFRFAPPLARIAAEVGHPAFRQARMGSEDDPIQKGESPSEVVAISRSASSTELFEEDERWTRLVSDGEPAWTDDFSNLLSALR